MYVIYIIASALDPFMLNWVDGEKPSPDYQSEFRECAVLGASGSSSWGPTTVRCGLKIPHVVCLKGLYVYPKITSQ